MARDSSSRAGPFSSCSATSAPRALGAGVGPGPSRRRPLSGCRLSRRSVRAAFPLWLAVTAFPPPATSLRVTTAFRRPCGTTRSSDSSRPFAICPFVLSGYRLFRGGREVSPGKNAQLPPTPSSLRAPSDGYRASLAAGRLTQGPRASRRFAFARCRGSPQTSTRPPLAGSPGLRHWQGPGPPDRRPCLLGAGFPPSGSHEDFHLLFRAHAGRTRSLVAPLLGMTGDDPS